MLKKVSVWYNLLRKYIQIPSTPQMKHDIDKYLLMMYKIV